MTERWTVLITCPRPRNRALDDFHTQPHKVARLAADWFGSRAELTLTARTVRLTCDYRHPPKLDLLHEQLATALHCLYLDTRAGKGFRLPRPVRTELRLDETDA